MSGKIDWSGIKGVELGGGGQRPMSNFANYESKNATRNLQIKRG